MITRWKYGRYPEVKEKAWMQTEPDGEWVRYTDHEEAVAEAIKAEREWAEKAIATSLVVYHSEMSATIRICDAEEIDDLSKQIARRVMAEGEVEKCG